MSEGWCGSVVDLYTPGEWSCFEAAVRQWLSGGSQQSGHVLIDDALLEPSEFTYAQSAHKWMVLLGLQEMADRIDRQGFRERDPLLGIADPA